MTAADGGLRWVPWAIAAAVLLRVAAAPVAPLIDDETYYWLWARHLDWSYLDHPPMIAYLLFTSTLAGDGPLWIRLPALLLGVLTTYALFLLGRDLFGARAGLIAALCFQVVPVLTGGGLLATPDVPLFLAWTVALRFLWRALGGDRRAWVIAGAAVGFGLLSKLSMVWFGVGAAIYAATRARDWLRRPEPYLAALLAAALFTPVLAWEVAHDWAVARFVLFERTGSTPRGPAGILEILAEQLPFALFLFPAFVGVLVGAWRRRSDARYAYLFWIAMPAVAFTVLAATTGASRGNWFGPAYLGLSVLLGAAWSRPVAALAAANAAVLAWGFAVLFVPALPLLPGAAEVYGWPQAAARVREELRDLGEGAIIVADRYQPAAQLAYYTRRAAPVTLLPAPNPASVWPPVDRFRNADAVAVLDARWTPRVDWSRHFTRVQEVPPLEVVVRGRPLRTFRVLRLYGLRAGPELAGGPP